MILFYMLIVILIFPAAGVILLVSVHESVSLINARQQQARAQNAMATAIKRATQEIGAIVGVGND